jgi:hypothetical protein
LAQHKNAQFAVAGKEHSNAVRLAEKSVINMIWLFLIDCPIIIIGPGGLLLVVPHLYAIPVSVLWVGLHKSIRINLDAKKYFAESHPEHRCRCST